MPRNSSCFSRKLAVAAVACSASAILLLPGSALAESGGVTPDGTGGTDPTGTTAPPAPPPTPGAEAKLRSTGLASAPASAPLEVKRAIKAANSIDFASYCTGGGHGHWHSRCYDCSGAVSYVLGPKGADILDSPLDSGSLERWGTRGRGSWITVYTNAGHAYVVIAGLRFDTSQPDDGASGPGWSKDVRAGLVNGPFQKRHFDGL